MRKTLDIREASDFLSASDSRMAALIKTCGPVKWRIETNLFAVLAFSIIGQQISTKAQQSICGKFCAILGKIAPGRALEAGFDNLRACGISSKKCGWILKAASAFESGEINVKHLRKMPDGDVVRELTKLDGVGVWTAEMMLIFSLGRPDVMSFGDFGIRNGLRKLLDWNEISKGEFEKFAKEKCSPYGSVASLYLWKLAGGGVPM